MRVDIGIHRPRDGEVLRADIGQAGTTTWVDFGPVAFYVADRAAAEDLAAVLNRVYAPRAEQEAA
jgi:hypothetical protein